MYYCSSGVGQWALGRELGTDHEGYIPLTCIEFITDIVTSICTEKEWVKNPKEPNHFYTFCMKHATSKQRIYLGINTKRQFQTGVQLAYVHMITMWQTWCTDMVRYGLNACQVPDYIRAPHKRTIWWIVKTSSTSQFTLLFNNEAKMS